MAGGIISEGITKDGQAGKPVIFDRTNALGSNSVFADLRGGMACYMNMAVGRRVKQFLIFGYGGQLKTKSSNCNELGPSDRYGLSCLLSVALGFR